MRIPNGIYQPLHWDVIIWWYVDVFLQGDLLPHPHSPAPHLRTVSPTVVVSQDQHLGEIWGLLALLGRRVQIWMQFRNEDAATFWFGAPRGTIGNMSLERDTSQARCWSVWQYANFLCTWGVLSNWSVKIISSEMASASAIWCFMCCKRSSEFSRSTSEVTPIDKTNWIEDSIEDMDVVDEEPIENPASFG